MSRFWGFGGFSGFNNLNDIRLISNKYEEIVVEKVSVVILHLRFINSSLKERLLLCFYNKATGYRTLKLISSL